MRAGDSVRRTVVWDRVARKQHARSGSLKDRERIENRINGLAVNPLPRGVKKLGDNLFRIRQGGFRVLYKLEPSEIRILEIGNRREFYR